MPRARKWDEATRGYFVATSRLPRWRYSSSARSTAPRGAATTKRQAPKRRSTSSTTRAPVSMRTSFPTIPRSAAPRSTYVAMSLGRARTNSRSPPSTTSRRPPGVIRETSIPMARRAPSASFRSRPCASARRSGLMRRARARAPRHRRPGHRPASRAARRRLQRSRSSGLRFRLPPQWRPTGPLAVLARNAAGARPRPRADVIPASQKLEHLVTDRAGETADEPTHEPDVPDMDRGPVRPEAAGLQRFGEEREDVGVGDGARGADELDAGLEQLALAGGHRGLLAEDRSEIRQPQRAVHLAVSLRDEARDGRGEVGSQ